MTNDIKQNIKEIDSRVRPDLNFDVIKRDIIIGGRRSALYFIDGFMKDAVFEKLMEFLYKITPEELAVVPDMQTFAKSHMPYTEADEAYDVETVVTMLLSGPAVLIIDGIENALVIDSRTYPLRGIEEPQKDRSVRGAKDGFVEALVMNTALIRRRIRDPRLRMEYHQIGDSSKVDVVISFIDGVADERVLKKLRERIRKAKISGISMTQQALNEALVPSNFLNPLPKTKFSERPDFASACLLEGKVIVVMDNSPGVMILPVSFVDFLKEVDDYYFPPVTGTYVRIVRLISTLLTVYLLPFVLYLYNNVSLLPEWLIFLVPEGELAIPIFLQFLILEFVVDALRLASVNTPDALSNSIGIIGGLILSEFAISAGWFVPQTILFASFVAIASFSQPSFEISYSAKFLRTIMLVLVEFFGLLGILIGTVFGIFVMAVSKTISGRNYLYPIFPFNFKDFCKIFVRTKIKNEQ
ncbi:MAG: spore germination protein [Clostridia bacterium]|nr:spore germination protein [Clostridia bacterium]